MTVLPTPGRPDASMTLLTSMLERPLDPGYAAAAARRTAAGLPAATSLRGPWVIVAAVVTGLVFSIGALTLRAAQTQGVQVRSELIVQIGERRALADDRAAQVGALQSDIATLANTALRAAQSTGLANQLQALRPAVGDQAVHGPALVVTLEDAPSPSVATGTPDPKAKVLSRDVSIVTNALWAAGAEAIAINGQRLTARSAIRFAGDAILVNFRPLVPPYAITAIGDPRGLPTAFADGVGAAYLKSLGDSFGLVTDVKAVADAVVPSASSVELTQARPLSKGSP